ncbi:DUF4192 family protein [Streptomyces fagopyri]|uniref:DUF4192 domain-containing protein n=1 Tax=Streptomyces fagopyri TaxID=2662397 RepID=UPI00371D0951
MTNHNEAAGASGDSDISGRGLHGADGVRGGDGVHGGRDDDGARAGHDECGTLGTPGGRWKKRSGHDGRDLPGGHQITLRTPSELADALPYLLGYRPEDSIVLAALHDGEKRGRFGGRARLGIPAQADDWPSVADQLAHGLVKGSERRGARPESMVAYLCQEPGSGESGRDVMERLRPLAQLLRTACGRLEVPVIEALCISDGRFWSYCCPGQGCCSPEGEAMGLPGTSVLAAAATYAGLQVRGSLRELTARLIPWERRAAVDQEVALDAANRALIPRILDDESRAAVSEETLAQARRLLKRFAEAPPVSGIRPADLRDDGLLETAEAATLILGLQDRTTRDRAAEWMEGDEAGPALRLWRALARRCVGSYGEHAAAPLTLAGWVAWSSGDELEAREALAMALGADPDYLFARLLHQACNEGLDPESIRRCLRAERTGRPGSEEGRRPGADPAAQMEAAEPSQPSPDSGVPAPAGTSDATAQPSGAGVRRRRRTRSAGNGGTRAGRRSPGARGLPAPRPAEDTSPTGDGPGRPSGRTSDRARARREGGRQGVGEET